eukprot:TRINITY_DN917_c0_g1::TRINITY_DN917_c0_g1_i1::g.16135::m.16135 TRINITY_DN917_c0_g1::TRINITY_DN917_c0_g1_i1::g.16135  ORF type:complete len:231 (+),score=20.18,sp/Q28ZX3/PABP2_DROPS/51.79/3e-54,RRM_1/PF00076.17/4.2e-17,RRM_6/PF14259.1/3.7e-13,RRM_5/PF13893.1/1.8e-09,DUF812/PF05667.6/0.028,DUF972/PF06156.8/0.044,DUF4055/PF13264.1/0.17 TRINITY_DN917_c0_g1_i1:44-694(+)
MSSSWTEGAGAAAETPEVSQEAGDARPAEDVEAEIAAMQNRMREMEEEAEKLKIMQQQVEREMTATNGSSEETDERSVYVGNVDYGASPEELQTHFQSCGTINRVTILCNKFTGHPMGYAYVEFADKESVPNALVMNETLFRGRQLKVSPKRTNVPGFARGRGGRGRGRGGPGPMMGAMGGMGGAPFSPRGRGRGGFFPRGRGRANYFHPYAYGGY